MKLLQCIPSKEGETCKIRLNILDLELEDANQQSAITSLQRYNDPFSKRAISLRSKSKSCFCEVTGSRNVFILINISCDNRTLLINCNFQWQISY